MGHLCLKAQEAWQPAKAPGSGMAQDASCWAIPDPEGYPKLLAADRWVQRDPPRSRLQNTVKWGHCSKVSPVLGQCDKPLHMLL